LFIAKLSTKTFAEKQGVTRAFPSLLENDCGGARSRDIFFRLVIEG
jgi:hypothetical protein